MATKAKTLPWRVNGIVDRYGAVRYYFRLPGQKPVRLPDNPRSLDFMRAYEIARGNVVELPAPVRKPIGAGRVAAGSLSDTIVQFYAAEAFTTLGPAHQRRHRQVLEKFRNEITEDNVPRGEANLVELTRPIVRQCLGLIEAYHRRRHLLNALRALCAFAVDAEMIDANPCEGIKLGKKPKTDGFATWSMEAVDKYRRHWAPGTMQRLALEILFNTALRRSDAVRLGPDHVRNGQFSIQPIKTKNVTGVWVTMPVHEDLQAALDAMPKHGAAFLQTSFGKPFTVAGFGNWFRDQCDAAGLHGLTAHGLRKAFLTEAALRGANPTMLMAAGGHTDIREVQLYTAAADRVRGGAEAARLMANTPGKVVRLKTASR
jgi:integrase